MASVSPARIRTATPNGMPGNVAPATATTASRSNRRSGPSSVISRAAADSMFPTSRLAIRNETGSAAPESGTPAARCPGLPRSWMVVSIPGATTSITLIGSSPRL